MRTNVSADVFLAELREATWYELKMKACNSAGCGNQSSQFATLDYDGSESSIYHTSLMMFNVQRHEYEEANLCLYFLCAGTIPPIKSPLEKNDDVKKLFSIGSPVILVTVGVALLFIIRKKRKEKRLKRLRGEGSSEGRVWRDNRTDVSGNVLRSCISFK